jgi:hypothetical protein
LLDEERAKARAAVNRQRDEYEAATPFEYMGKPFDYDKTSRERLTKAIQTATLALIAGAPPATPAAEWTLANNEKHPMTLAELAGFPQAEAARSQQLHDQANAIKSRIEAAADVAAVDAIMNDPNLWEVAE